MANINWSNEKEIESLRTYLTGKGLDSGRIESYLNSKRVSATPTPEPVMAIGEQGSIKPFEKEQPVIETMAQPTMQSDTGLPSMNYLKPKAQETSPMDFLSQKRTEVSGITDFMPKPTITKPVATPQPERKKIMGADTKVTQTFMNYNPRIEPGSGYNTGVDLRASVGTPLSTPPGQWEVTEAFNGAREGGARWANQGWGNSVVIQNAKTGEKMRFSHLSNVGVKPGQIIKEGQVFGATGATGNVRGAHLDLMYWMGNGKLADITKSQYWQYF